MSIGRDYFQHIRCSIGPVAEGTVRLTAAITQDEDWFVARCLEVEVASQGQSVEEALANLREALELYFEDEPVPQHLRPPIVAPVEVHVPLLT